MKFIVSNVLMTLTVFVSVHECAKILAVIPSPSISHQEPFRPLLHELARRGHHVTVITTDPAFPKGKAPQNLTEIDLHDISYNIWRTGLFKYIKGDVNDFYSIIKAIFSVTLDVLDAQMQSEEVQKIIHGNEEYDLLILEGIVQGALAFTHRFKVPVIQMSSFGALHILTQIHGIPTHPVLYPSPPVQRVYNLTFGEKVHKIFEYYFGHKIFEEAGIDQQRVMKKYFGEDLPSIDELKNRPDLLFLNVHPIFEGNHPNPPAVVHVWGIHQKPQKELPKDLKNFLNSSKNGVIYFSFGTNTDPANLPPQIIQMFIRVFSQLPYDVLWKWSLDELPGKTENIRIGKWFPQSDLLRHPKIKLFITQGGLQSTDEAINAGVPLVGIPMLADQWYNVEKYVHFGIGEKLNAETLTEEQFRNAIVTVINNDSYRKNIQKLKEVMRDEPLPPLERAVWWVEYVLRHKGARHLRSPGANISYSQYFEVQFLSTLFIGLAVVLSIVVYALNLLYAYFVKNLLFKEKVKKQ